MVSCCSGGLAVRTAAAWYYVLGVKEDTLLFVASSWFDFITLPTLKMHGQTQIECSRLNLVEDIHLVKLH
jgi:hypothetical protein